MIYHEMKKPFFLGSNVSFVVAHTPLCCALNASYAHIFASSRPAYSIIAFFIIYVQNLD